MAMSDRGSGETEWTDALQQIISNPQASTQVALDYCNGEMANCLKVTDEQAARIAELEGLQQQAQERTARERLRISEQGARIVELEATNAALVAFVAADDAFGVASERGASELTAASYNALIDSVDRKTKARQLLATDHGIPLPGQEG